jgi:hypothetical protein
MREVSRIQSKKVLLPEEFESEAPLPLFAELVLRFPVCDNSCALKRRLVPGRA